MSWLIDLPGVLFGPDVLRTVVVAVCILVAGAVCAVGWRHWRAWRVLPGRAGLTPLHVALVSAGVLMWGLALAWALVDGLGRPLMGAASVARLVMYFVGGIIILAALFVVGGLQRRRTHFCKQQQVIVQESDTVTVTEDTPPPGLRKTDPMAGG